MNARSVLYVLLDQARLERAQQLHFDALDGKAGILLGFAGALIALAPSGLRVALDGGRAAAVVAAYFALRTFRPRSIPITKPACAATRPYGVRRGIHEACSRRQSDRHREELKGHPPGQSMATQGLDGESRD